MSSCFSPTRAPCMNYRIRLHAQHLRTSVRAQYNAIRQVPTIRELCEDFVPEDVLRRAKNAGFIRPTEVQLQALPMLFSGRDCILHSQTGSGKTLAYLLLIFAVLNPQSAVQALIVVPTKKIGMQVAKIARMLAAEPPGFRAEQKYSNVMTILDIGLLRKLKNWLQGELPPIVVATVGSLCKALEGGALKLQYMQVLVIDEFNFTFHKSDQVATFRKLMASYSTVNARQTIFAVTKIPDNHRFVLDCIQDKWTKADVTHIHVNPVEPMRCNLCHRFVICGKNERDTVLLSLLRSDIPKFGLIFINQQSMAGGTDSEGVLIEFLKTSCPDGLEVHHLEEKMNTHGRETAPSVVGEGNGHLIVVTDVAVKGVDLPEATHIYNYDLPRTAGEYLHRARTGQQPSSNQRRTVTNLVTATELFVLRRYEIELRFECQELVI